MSYPPHHHQHPSSSSSPPPPPTSSSSLLTKLDSIQQMSDVAQRRGNHHGPLSSAQPMPGVLPGQSKNSIHFSSSFTGEPNTSFEMEMGSLDGFSFSFDHQGLAHIQPQLQSPPQHVARATSSGSMDGLDNPEMPKLAGSFGSFDLNAANALLQGGQNDGQESMRNALLALRQRHMQSNEDGSLSQSRNPTPTSRHDEELYHNTRGCGQGKGGGKNKSGNDQYQSSTKLSSKPSTTMRQVKKSVSPMMGGNVQLVGVGGGGVGNSGGRSKKTSLMNNSAAVDEYEDEETDRGKYRCGRCGKFKVNHVCSFITDAPCRSISIQADPVEGLMQVWPEERFITVGKWGVDRPVPPPPTAIVVEKSGNVSSSRGRGGGGKPSSRRQKPPAPQTTIPTSSSSSKSSHPRQKSGNDQRETDWGQNGGLVDQYGSYYFAGKQQNVPMEASIPPPSSSSYKSNGRSNQNNNLTINTRSNKSNSDHSNGNNGSFPLHGMATIEQIQNAQAVMEKLGGSSPGSTSRSGRKYNTHRSIDRENQSTSV